MDISVKMKKRPDHWFPGNMLINNYREYGYKLENGHMFKEQLNVEVLCLSGWIRINIMEEVFDQRLKEWTKKVIR